VIEGELIYAMVAVWLYAFEGAIDFLSWNEDDAAS
jgi:hypothetical protein